jgi:hypothetical protein
MNLSEIERQRRADRMRDVRKKRWAEPVVSGQETIKSLADLGTHPAIKAILEPKPADRPPFDVARYHRLTRETLVARLSPLPPRNTRRRCSTQ